MMDFQWRIACLKALSPSLIFGLAGVATISAISGLHMLCSRTLKMLHESKRRNTPRMKGVVIRSYGGIPSVEVRADLPVPKILHEDEVLLKVIAAGVDSMDLLVTKGYGRAIRSHLRRNNDHIEDDSMIILGRECSGIVLNTGKNVTCVTKGNEVWAVSAYCLEGLMAEYVVVKDTQVALKPQNLTFEEAASLPYTSIQVCNALLNQASLNSKSAKDKRILLITGNSPVGLFAMQLLKSWGGDVTTAVPTAGLPMCHELGADDVIVYSVTDFETELRNRKKFDIILNAIGTIIHQLCVDISSPGGKVITFTTTPILSDKFDVLWGSCLAGLLQIIAWIKKMKQGILTNFWWDNFSYDREYLVKTSAFVEERKISPIIERVYELDDAIVAFQQLAKYENIGKNVLRISQKI